jgi:phage tail protein X
MSSFNIETQDGDRIDNLAQRFYGGLYGISIIADANPLVAMEPIYPLGTVLVIPIIDDTQIQSNIDLPPWKKNNFV